jgi:DNA repair protein RecO (recombination protein O)
MASNFQGGALQVTSGMVLRTIKHTERRVIARMCTERFGTRDVVMRAGRKAAVGAALQPLSRVELVVAVSEGRDLLVARDLRLERPYGHLSSDPVRGALALFMQELLLSVLREEVADPELYVLLGELLEELDTGMDPAGYPLRAMVALLGHLGIRPDAEGRPMDGFDLREGRFFTGAAPHELCMPVERAHLFNALLTGGAGDIGAKVPYGLRKALLSDLGMYYRLHVEGFGELRSPAVLHAVLA